MISKTRIENREILNRKGAEGRSWIETFVSMCCEIIENTYLSLPPIPDVVLLNPYKFLNDKSTRNIFVSMRWFF